MARVMARTTARARAQTMARARVRARTTAWVWVQTTARAKALARTTAMARGADDGEGEVGRAAHGEGGGAAECVWCGSGV
jgi:hypothetical protein